MRVTSSMMARTTMRDLASKLSQLQETQNRITTGKQYLRASANPSAAGEAMLARQSMRRVDQMSREIDDAKGWLGASDAALTTGLDALQRASDITIRAANTGGGSQPSTLAAYAAQIRSIRAEMLSLANTSYGDRSVFNGNAAGPAYDANGVYLGDTGTVVRDIAPNLSMNINVTGPEAFGTGGGTPGNLFEVLDRLAAAIESGDNSAIAVEQANLAGATQTLAAATATIGVRGERLDAIAERTVDDRLRLRTQLSNVEDVDIVDALIRSKEQEAGYQASLQVAAKVFPMSLMDFLR